VIGVIDYRAGNAPSVGYALERLGIEHALVTKGDELDSCGSSATRNGPRAHSR
jgi:imidazoleglycerol phosphate synthase glutamine amidotransferase subunit HisH